MPGVVVTLSSPFGRSRLSVSLVRAASSFMNTSCAVRYSSSPCSVRISPRAWRWNSETQSSLFERANLARYRRLRQAKLLAGMGEAAGFRRGVENLQLVPVHR